jgi:hypothetical protein
MINIIIDYNNDQVHIKDENTKPYEVTYYKIKDCKMIQNILEEVFNRMNSEFTGLGITLSQYNEEHHTNIGEW